MVTCAAIEFNDRVRERERERERGSVDEGKGGGHDTHRYIEINDMIFMKRRRKDRVYERAL